MKSTSNFPRQNKNLLVLIFAGAVLLIFPFVVQGNPILEAVSAPKSPLPSSNSPASELPQDEQRTGSEAAAAASPDAAGQKDSRITLGGGLTKGGGSLWEVGSKVCDDPTRKEVWCNYNRKKPQ